MLDLWGMGGGLVEYRSALLASRGYASFTIAYIGHKDLPGPKNRINVGDSYFKVGGVLCICPTQDGLQYMYYGEVFLNCSIFLFGQAAFHLLRDHHQVCGDRIGIIGLSFGTYLCLRLAMQTDVNVLHHIL